VQAPRADAAGAVKFILYLSTGCQGAGPAPGAPWRARAIVSVPCWIGPAAAPAPPAPWRARALVPGRAARAPGAPRAR